MEGCGGQILDVFKSKPAGFADGLDVGGAKVLALTAGRVAGPFVEQWEGCGGRGLGLREFPVAAVANHHEFCGLK